MKPRIIIFIIFLFCYGAFCGEVSNPFGPVGEKILSKQVFFNNHPIDRLNLLTVTDTGHLKKALIKDEDGIEISIHEGDLIGRDSGRVILIDENRVVVLVRKKVSGKTVIRIEIIK